MKFADLWGKRLVFFDGAMGTMLQQAGLKGGELPELWNWEKPEVVEEIHRRYRRGRLRYPQNQYVWRQPL